MAGRSSNNILHAIRTEVFGDSQTRFGKRLGLTKETILRLEGRKEGHRISPKHLRWLRQLRAPSGKAERMQALLAELEASIQEEMRTGEPFDEHAPDSVPMPPTEEQGETGAEPLRLAERSEESARRAEEIAQRLEQLWREEEARRAEAARSLGETSRQMAAMAQRLEQLWREEEARRSEAARTLEETSRHIGALVQRLEQIRAEDEARRAEEARHASQAAREGEAVSQKTAEDRMAAERRARRRALVTVAASLVVGMFGGSLVQNIRSGASTAASDTGRTDAPVDGREFPVEPMPEPEEEHWSGGADAGVEPKKLLPIPERGGLPGQRAAPCQPGSEEINGFCWLRVSFTDTQVKDGVCDNYEYQIYEPSAGWCRANHAGYMPVRARRRPNNAVDPR